jgi:DNA-binding NarL/FixJ family response regulator
VAAVNGNQGRGHDGAVAAIIGEPRPLMRAALGRCLGESGFSVRGEGSDAAGMIELALAERPGVCLLASDLPGGAITALVAIHSAVPEAAVVIVSDRESVGEALECIRLGAAGYLSKDIAYEALPRALHGVLRGEAALSRTMTKRLLLEIRALEPAGLVLGVDREPTGLTLREVQVLRLLTRGWSTAEIARTLSISPITARRHCGEICRKLGARDRAAVVALVGRQLLPH